MSQSAEISSSSSLRQPHTVFLGFFSVLSSRQFISKAGEKFDLIFFWKFIIKFIFMNNAEKKNIKFMVCCPQ